MPEAHDFFSIATELPVRTARLTEREGKLTIDVDSADTAQALLLALEQWAAHRAATLTVESGAARSDDLLA